MLPIADNNEHVCSIYVYVRLVCIHAHTMFKRSCSQFETLELNGAHAYTCIHIQYTGLVLDYSLRELIIKEQNNRQEKKRRRMLLLFHLHGLLSVN
jgi:hypothetical protein